MFKNSNKRVKAKPSINIVIIRTSSIGDVVLSTACLNLIDRLKLKYNLSFNLTWIGSDPSLEFIRVYYPEVYSIDIKKTGFFKTLIKTLFHRRVHIILNLQNNIRAWLFSYILGLISFKKVYSYDKRSKDRSTLILTALKQGRSRVLDRKIIDSDSGFKLFKSMSLSLLKAIKTRLKSKQYKYNIGSSGKGINIDSDLDTVLNEVHPCFDTKKIRFKEVDKKYLNQINPYQYNLVVSRGGSFDPKKAPLDLLVKIFNQLQSMIDSKTKDKLNLIFIGSGSDKQYNDQLIEKLSPDFKIIDFTSKLSLIQTSLVLARSNMLLGNDSLHFHLMEAVGKKSIGLWGPTFESFGFSCWNKDSIIFSSLIGCRPCSKHGQTPCRFDDYECFNQIDPAQISRFIAEDINNYLGTKKNETT